MCVIALISVILVLKKVVKKLSSHCSNAVAFDQGSCNKTFAARYFYNTSFVHSHLFDSQHIGKLKSMCRYAKPSVLYSDVLKKSQLLDVEKQSNKTFFKCFNKIPDHDKFGRGKSVDLYSSNSKSPLKSRVQVECQKNNVFHTCVVI